MANKTVINFFAKLEADSKLIVKSFELTAAISAVCH